MLFNVEYTRCMRKTTHVNLTMTKRLMMAKTGIISNADIQKLEGNNEGKLSINVYRISSELQSEPISLYRRRNITKATYEIDLLKLEEGDNSHYPNMEVR